MGFRFRKRIRLAKGIYWNLGSKGSSLSIGGRGARRNRKNLRTSEISSWPVPEYEFHNTFNHNHLNLGSPMAWNLIHI